jgi:hypothetical protein
MAPKVHKLGIVIGLDLPLALATRRKYKTILWTQLRFTSTWYVMHVCRITASLKEVAARARGIYLPWLRKPVLGDYSDALLEDAQGRHSSTMSYVCHH